MDAGMQSLVNRVAVSPRWRGAPVAGVLLFHEHWLLWSTLKHADTSSLHQLFAWALQPAIKAATQNGITRKFIRPVSWARDEAGSKAGEHCLLRKSSWLLLPSGLLLANSPGGPWSTPPVDAPQIPSVWLHACQEWCSLLLLRVEQQLLMVVLPRGIFPSHSAAEACLSEFAPLMRSLSSSVAQHVHSVKRLHVPGYRYQFTDDMLAAERSSPGNKVATLSRGSLALAGSTRACLEPQAAEGQDAEVIAWGQHDCWVVAKQRGLRKLVLVLEQQGKEGLLEAAGAADRFAKAQFLGLFDD